jgi:predicted transcriptional regulator of viral defense system
VGWVVFFAFGHEVVYGIGYGFAAELAQRLGFIIELLKERKGIQVDQAIIDELLSLSSSKVYRLDIEAPKRGEISRKWRIINNAGTLEI